MLNATFGRAGVVPMIYVVSGQDAGRYSALMEQVYRLRYRVSAEEFGWGDLATAQGLERDQEERPDAVHHICVRDGAVTGYQCLLPTVGPHVQGDGPAKRGPRQLPRGLEIYELARYCVAPACCEGGCGSCGAASELIAGLVEWGLACRVGKIVIAFKPYWLIRVSQLKFRVRPLGTECGSGSLGPVLLEFDAATLLALRDYRGHRAPVASFLGEHDGKGAPRAM
jgi:acyl-homoserine lactone synthase